ncbi:uncharacterized protein Dmul_09490 [Desulfococcus multivorans]|nr:uncharacterized protein Dmul_09490 [Desulfococcus multivorans]
MGAFPSDDPSQGSCSGDIQAVDKGDDVIPEAVEDEQRFGVGTDCRQIVKRIPDQECRHAISSGKRADAGEAGYEDHGGRRPLCRQLTGDTASQGTTGEDDSVGIDVGPRCEPIVGRRVNRIDAGLGGPAAGPSISRVFHQQKSQSQLCEGTELLQTPIDQLRIAVGEDHDGSALLFRVVRRGQVPCPDPVAVEVEPDDVEAGNGRGAGCRTCHSCRKYDLALEKEQHDAVNEI